MADTNITPGYDQEFSRTIRENQPTDFEKLGPDYAPGSEFIQEGAQYIPIPVTPTKEHSVDIRKGLFDDITADAYNIKPEVALRPDYFNWEGSNAQMYKNSPHYKELGFDPNIGQLNEEKYAANQTAGDVLKRTFGGWTSGVVHGFADMASHWGTLASAIGSGDLGKLYSQEVIDEVNRKQKEFDNDWHIFKGESTGVLTKVASGIQGSGHLIGAIGEMVTEQLALDALAALTFGATSEVNVAAGLSESARLGAMADKLSQSLTTPSMLKNLWNGMVRGTEYVGKSVPGFGNTVGGWGKLAAEGMEAEGSAMRVMNKGFGNFIRDMRGANMATSFASGNAAGTYQQMVNSRTQQYMKEHDGISPDDIEMENIKSQSLRTAKADGAINAVGMLMMESMAFGNLLAPRKLISESMEEGGAGIWGNIGMKPVGVAGAKEAPLYVKNQIKWNNLRASMFQRGSEVGNYGEVGKNILKHSTSFGVTMNMMGAIDNGVKAWFNAKYDHNDISMWDGAKIGAYSQFSKEGKDTFISGFLTGALLHGVGSILSIPTRAGIEKIGELRDKNYQAKKDAIRTQTEEYVEGANRLWADPLQPLTKEHKIYKEETDDTLHNVNSQNGFSDGMQRTAGTGAKKEFHDIEDDASREVLIKLMRNKLADSWVQRAKDYAATLNQDGLTQMFNVDSTPENYTAIINSINKLEPRLKNLKDIVRQVDSAFKNPFNPYATDPQTGKRLYEDGSEAFIREYTDWKTHSGMKDYVIAIKDKALRANQRQKEIFYGTSDSTGLVDMPFAEDLGMTTLMTASSLDLLQNELNILQEMATNGDIGARDTVGPLKEYQEVLNKYTSDYKDILDKGGYPERDADIAKLNERYKNDLADKFHSYIGKTLELKNMKGKVIDSKPLPEINDVRDAIDRMMDYYQLQAEEGTVLMKINALLDPKISRAFQDIYFREKAARDRQNRTEEQPESTWAGTGPRPKDSTTVDAEDAVVVTDEPTFQDREKEVVEYLTAIPDGERFTYDNDIINSIPEGAREEFIDEIESIVRTADNLEDRNKKITEAVQETYDQLHDRFKTQTEKEYPSLRVGISYMGDSGYAIVDSTVGNKPVNSKRFSTVRAANRAIDSYIDTEYPIIEDSTFRVGEHISLNTGDEKGKTYRIWSTELINNERVAVLKETVPHYDDKGKEMGIRTTGNTIRVPVDELNKNYVTGKVEPVIKKDQFNPNYPKLSIPDALVSVGIPRVGPKETAEDKLNMIRTVSTIPVEDMKQGTGFSIAIRQNIGDQKEIPINNNPQALYKTQQFSIELRHNGELVGYVTNPTYYTFRPNGGKGTPKNVPALTIDDVKALFKNIPRLSTAEQWHKHLNSTYNQALQFLGKITEGMMANGIPSVEISDLGGVIKFNTVYSYDWIKKGEVGATLGEVFDNMGIDTPEYYITRNDYVEGEGKKESDLVVNSTMSEEDEAIAEKTPAIGQLGMYKAVIKLPGGEFHAIHLVPKQMDEVEVTTMLDKVANATDTEGAEVANEELRKLFISLPVYDENGVKNDMQNMVITPTVFTTGKEPVVSILITQDREASGKPVQVGKGQFTIVSLKGEDGKISTDRFIEKVNEVLGKEENAHLDIPDITADNLKTQPEDLLDMETSVTKNLFRDLSVSYEVIDPKGGERIIEAIIQQQPAKENEQDTKELYDTDENEGHYQLSDEEIAAAYGLDVAVPDIIPQGLSLEGNEYDNSIMDEDQDADIDDLSSLFDAEQEELEKQSSKKVSKIQSNDLSKEDVEDIDTFTQVIKDTFPEGLITIGEIDTVSENMARNGVVVGQFYTYLNEVGDVQGRIETKAQNPGKYHESMHAVMRMLLTDEQYRETIDRAKVDNPVTKKKLKAFKKEHPRYENMSEEQLKDEYQEEFIADEYDKFASGHSKKMKLPWLQRLFNKIGYWLQYMKDLLMNNRMRAMFYEVKIGKYKNAKLQDNQFTRDTSAAQPVPMIKTSFSKRTVNVTLPDGSTVERTNVFTKFLPEQESSQLLNNITAEAFSEMNGQRVPDINKAIDTVINRYADSFNIDKESPARTHLLSIKDKAIRMETARNLKEYGNIFNNAGNKEVIKNEIRHNLHINGLKQEIDGESYDTEVNEVGDRNADTKFLDKQSGGYGSIGSNIKRDMASTFTTVAELSKGAPNKWGFTHHADGKPMVQGIDTNVAYAGMLKTLSDTFDSQTAMKKLIAYSTIGDNPNISTYIDRVLRETGFDIERFNRTGEMMAVDMQGANRLNGILSAFMQQNKNYLNVIMDPDTKKVIVADSNRESVDKKQCTEWANGFNDTYVSRAEEKGVYKQAAGKVASSLKDFRDTSFTDAAKKRAITDQKLTDIANSTSQKLFDLTKINLHPDYWKYSILVAKDADVVLTPLQRSIVESFEGVEPIDYKELQINFLDKLEKNINPFSRGDNEYTRTAWEKVALKYADENAKFDEDVDVTSHKNANGDTVYNYGYPSYNTVEVVKLNTPAGIQAKLSDPQTKGSHLLSDPKFLGMKKAISTVGAVSSQSTKATGSAYEGIDMPEELEDNDNTTLGGREKNAIDFSNFLPRDYSVFMLGKYAVEKQKDAKNTKGNFWTVPVSLGINEAKSTHILSRLPFYERVTQAPDVLWKLNDKSKEILYNSVADEVEQIKRAYSEIEEGQEARMQKGEVWKKDFHDGKLKGTKLFRTKEMLGEELSKEIEDAIRDNRDFDVSTIKDKIEKTIQDNLYTQIGEFIKVLKEERLIKEDGSNSKLPEFLFNGYGSDKLNQELGMRKGSFTRNLANVYMNEYIQYMGMTHLLYGDTRERVKSITDMWKRNAGLNGTYNKVIPTVGYGDYVPTGKFSHITFEDDMFTTIWGDKKERDDGQMYTDPYSYSLFLLGQGKLGDHRADILKKMSNGTRLTKAEQKEILKNKSASNPLKLVYDDAKVYLKSSVTPLFYEDVAVKENGEWVAIKGRERAFNILQNMVQQAKATGQPVLASPVSVNKGAKENIVDINGTVEEHHWRERSGQFLGNQVDNPTGGRVGVWPVQIGYQIAADQNADGDYYMDGKKMKGSQVISKYMDALAARKDRTFLNTISSIYEPVKNKEEVSDVAFDAGKFMERIHDVLLATGSDSQTMELFSVNELKEAKYNINLAPLVEKAIQLWSSMFFKGGTQQKVPMVKFTMMADSGFKIMRKALEVVDGEVVKWEVIPIREYAKVNREFGIKDTDIQVGDHYMDDLKASVPMYNDKGVVTGYYSEGLRPFLFDSEIDNQQFDDAYKEILSSRIPGTDMHSNSLIRWVDTISQMYGDTAIYSKDIMTRDGHDKDLDKGFGQMFDTYIDNEGKRKRYGSATTPEGKFEEFKLWMLNNKTEVRRLYKGDTLYSTEEAIGILLGKDVDDKRLTDILRLQKLPTTVAEFTKAGGDKLTIGTQTNIALSAQMSMLSSEHTSGGGLDAIINRPTTTQHILDLTKSLIDTLSFTEEGQTINPLTQKIIDRLNDKEYDQNGMLGQLKAYDANSTGKSDVGAIANMIQVAHILKQFNVSLREGFGIWFNGKELKSYGSNKTIIDRSKFQGLDTIAQMDVDAAKDHLPSRFNLSTEFTGYIGNMVALGMDETTALLYPLTKVWDDYKKEVSNSGGLFGEKKQYGETWLNNRFMDMEKEGAHLNKDITHEDIVNYLKTEQNDLDMNYTLLDHLERTRAITENGARNISKILRLDNARNLIDFEQVDDVLSTFDALGVGKSDVAFEISDISFDIRSIITNEHSNIAENYKQLQLIAGPLSKKAFLSRQNISQYAKSMVLTNFNVPERDKVFKKELMHDWNSYLSVVGLKKYLTDNGMYEVLESMNQDIMWSDSTSPKNIATIVESVRGLKGADRNRFANSLAVIKPVPGKSSVTQANINTWVKMSEQMQRKLVDSFRELVASTDENKYKAGLAFFNYLLVASGGQFKNGSFIRFTPEFMFKDWSTTMNKIIEMTSKDFETEDERDAAFLQVFNTPYLQVVENFMKAYSTNIGNKGYLKSPGYSNFANFTPNFTKEGYDLSEKEVLEYNERTTEFLMPGDSRLPFNIDIATGKVSVNIFNGIRENEWVDAGQHGMVRVKKGKFSKVEKVLRDRNLSYLRSGGFNTTVDSQMEFPFSVRIGNQLYTLTRVGRQEAKSFNTLLSEGETIPKGISAVYERSEFTGDYKQWKAANAVFGLPAERTVQPEKEEIIEEPVIVSGQPVVPLQTVPKVSSFTDLKKSIDINALDDKDRETFEDMSDCFS